MIKKYLTIIIVLLVLLLIETISIFFIRKNISQNNSNLSENYQEFETESEPDVQVNVVFSELENTKKGEYYEVKIFLGGEDTDLVSGFETFLEFDSSQMEFVSATSSGFFENPIEISLGENGLLSVSANPENVKSGNLKNNIDLSVFVCRFLVKEEVSLKVSLNEQKTQIYLSGIGGYKPLVYYK